MYTHHGYFKSDGETVLTDDVVIFSYSLLMTQSLIAK